MAAPNLIGATTILGKTGVLSVSTTATDIVTNSSGSNKVLKVNSLYVSNIDGATDEVVTVDLFRSSVAYHVAKTINVPADTTLDVINKLIYLEEGDSLRLTAGANSRLQAVCSYEEIA